MKKWNVRQFAVICFSFYCVLMLILLFDRESRNFGLGYWKTVSLNYNLIPFTTITKYVKILIHGRHSLYADAIINLFGNVLMFVPLGYLLPLIWNRLRKIWVCMVVSFSAIIVVELLQLFTLTGSLDIDDLILNLCGVSLGYFLYCLPDMLFQKNA